MTRGWGGCINIRIWICGTEGEGWIIVKKKCKQLVKKNHRFYLVKNLYVIFCCFINNITAFATCLCNFFFKTIIFSTIFVLTTIFFIIIFTKTTHRPTKQQLALLDELIPRGKKISTAASPLHSTSYHSTLWTALLVALKVDFRLILAPTEVQNNAKCPS